jgi:benzoylformate decarboxylase
MNASHRPTVREATISLLRGLGIQTVFGNPGSTELPLFRDFPADFRYVLGLQESVVVGMADGHAQATRHAAFVNLHSAAGVGHAMGAIFTASKNRTPLVITAGQQARSLLPFEPFLHSANAPELPKPHVKWSCEPARACDVPRAIARGFHIAMTEPRGPVFVSVPADDWDREAEPVAERLVSQRVAADPSLLARVGEMLDAARKPAILAGPAVDRGMAWHEVVALAERHNARVFSSPLAGRYGFPEDHRLFAGALRAQRQAMVQAMAGHDLILVIGAPAFVYHVEGEGPYLPPGAQVAQLIEDPGIAAWSPEGLSVVGHIAWSVKALLMRPAPRPRAAPAPRPAAARLPVPGPAERIGTGFVFQTLADLRRPGDVFVEEAPTSRAMMQRHLPIVEPESFYAMCSGGLGFGMSAAVGIALGRPGRRVVACIGDGSAMYTIQSLWSAAQLRLPITFVILKNGRYAALQDFAPAFGYAPGSAVAGTDLPDIDFVGLAHAQGCAARRVQRGDALRGALEQALACPTPTLVEVEVA